MSESEPLTTLSFTVSGRIGRPIAEVYDAVADPQQLTRYFATGGARGRLEPGAEVSWDFADFPGRFPVTVVEADAPHRIVIEWEGQNTASESGRTRTTFAFSPIDDGVIRFGTRGRVGRVQVRPITPCSSQNEIALPLLVC